MAIFSMKNMDDIPISDLYPEDVESLDDEYKHLAVTLRLSKHLGPQKLMVCWIMPEKPLLCLTLLR